MRVSGKPTRPHWRRPADVPRASSTVRVYAPSVRAHSETVPCGFYAFHLEAGSGPIVNPFPLDRSRRAGGRTRITIRWSRIVRSGPGIDRGCRPGLRAVSRTRSLSTACQDGPIQGGPGSVSRTLKSL
jgi:hypothetical protein